MKQIGTDTKANVQRVHVAKFRISQKELFVAALQKPPLESSIFEPCSSRNHDEEALSDDRTPRRGARI